jgi:hypothetical protein
MKRNKIGKNLSLPHAWAEVLKPAQTLFVVDDLDQEKKLSSSWFLLLVIVRRLRPGQDPIKHFMAVIYEVSQ